MPDILVVDRENTLLPNLSHWHYTVEFAETYELAIGMLRQSQVEVIILAVYADTSDWVQAIEKFYDVNPEVRIIAIGDQSSLALERQVRLAKVFFYTVRPVDLAELKAVLQRATCRGGLKI